MKRFYRLAVLLLSLSGLLGSCGQGGNGPGNYPDYYPVYYPGYEGTFLSWTSSADAAHSFTLVRVDGQTGAVTNIGGFNFFPEIVYAPDGTLYGISDELHIINPADGSTVLIGTLDYGAEIGILMHGAAFSPAGTLYVVENGGDRVFTVNLTTAALTYVGTPTALIWDLEFASDGTLYGAFADLFILNAANMTTVTKVGSTGTFISPMAFDSGGTLFGMDIYPSTKICSLNLGTGLATPVVATSSIGLRSLVVERTSSAPAGSLFSKALALHGYSSPKPFETLLSQEKEIKSAHKLLHDSVK